jgi:hypothetical protein
LKGFGASSGKQAPDDCEEPQADEIRAQVKPGGVTEKLMVEDRGELMYGA